MTYPNKIEVGQIWLEVDPRFDRFVRVEEVGQRIQIKTVERASGGWRADSWTRAGYASPLRFNGKRGGYKFVESAGGPE